MLRRRRIRTSAGVAPRTRKFIRELHNESARNSLSAYLAPSSIRAVARREYATYVFLIDDRVCWWWRSRAHNSRRAFDNVKQRQLSRISVRLTEPEGELGLGSLFLGRIRIRRREPGTLIEPGCFGRLYKPIDAMVLLLYPSIPSYLYTCVKFTRNFQPFSAHRGVFAGFFFTARFDRRQRRQLTEKYIRRAPTGRIAYISGRCWQEDTCGCQLRCEERRSCRCKENDILST